MKRVPVRWLIALGLSALVPLTATADGGDEPETIKLNGESAAGDQYGFSSGISGDTVVIGAPLQNGRRGAAYVYELDDDGLVMETMLTASDAGSGDEFGSRVDISRDTIVVGSRRDDDAASNAGAVYVFQRGAGDSWTQVQKLTAADAAINDEFGREVVLDRHTIVVGAPLKDGEKGAAYMFSRHDGIWTQDAKVTASDGVAGDQFGFRLGVDRSLAVIGARRDDNERGVDAGAAYVFKHDDDGGSWNETQKLVAADGGAGDEFSQAVAIEKRTIVVGAPRHDSASVSDSGAGYVYTCSGSGSCQLLQTLTAPTPVANEFVGRSIDIHGDTIAVPGPGDDFLFTGPGTVYLFERHHHHGQWSSAGTLTSDDGAAGDQFGYRVSIGDDAIVATALRDDDLGAESGSAYVFFRDDDCD